MRRLPHPSWYNHSVTIVSVVSALGSITHGIARRSATELQPFIGNTASYIKNSSHLLEKPSSFKLHKFFTILVSVDITSLLTNISTVHPDTVSLIITKLPQDLAVIVEFCLQSAYFLFDSQNY